jgi:hypothetical protein
MATEFLSWALQPKSGPGLPFLGFLNNNLLRGWIVSPAPNPNLEDQVSVFMTLGDSVAQLYTPWHWVPILVTFYDMHGLQWDYSLIPATMRKYIYIYTHTHIHTHTYTHTHTRNFCYNSSLCNVKQQHSGCTHQ